MKAAREGIMPRTKCAERAKELAVFKYIHTAGNIAAGEHGKGRLNTADYPLTSIQSGNTARRCFVTYVLDVKSAKKVTLAAEGQKCPDENDGAWIHGLPILLLRFEAPPILLVQLFLVRPLTRECITLK